MSLREDSERREPFERRGRSERFILRFASQTGIESEIHETLYGEFGAVEGLVIAVIQRDAFTRQHLVHTNHLSHRFATALHLRGDDRTTFLRAALLHDLGKIAIPDDLLMKPSALEPEQYAHVQLHAAIGETILAPYRAYRRVAKIVGQHHEHYAGGGYPRNLRGAAIDPLARAVSVIDAFSAMVLPRPYHRGIDENEALAELERCAGSQFDPHYVDVFVQMIKKEQANIDGHSVEYLGGVS